MDTVGSVVGGLLGGSAGASSGPASMGTIYPNVSQNNQTYQQLLGNNVNNANAAQQASGAATNTFNNAYNNPYSGQLQQGAGVAGNALSGVGNSSLQNSSSLSSGANSLLPYIQQIMKQGMDPQNALYNQQAQQVRDQSNVTNAQSGISGPYAAGVTGTNLNNFNNNWQNQQLERSLAALSGGGAALNQAGSVFGQAQNQGATAAGDIYSGASLPYNAANAITSGQTTDINNLIGSLGGINNIDSQTMSSLLAYLNQAGSYGISQNKQQGADASAGAAGGSDIGSDIGSALSMASMFL